MGDATAAHAEQTRSENGALSRTRVCALRARRSVAARFGGRARSNEARRPSLNGHLSAHLNAPRKAIQLFTPGRSRIAQKTARGNFISLACVSMCVCVSRGEEKRAVLSLRNARIV